MLPNKLIGLQRGGNPFLGAVFDGVNDFMRRGSIGGSSSANPGQGILSVWLRVPTSGAARSGYVLYHKDVGASGESYTLVNFGTSSLNGRLSLATSFDNRARDGIVRTADASSPNDGKWHHYLMGYNGSNAYAYGDGFDLTNITNAFAGTATKNNWNQNTVGAEDDNTTKFEGEMAELWWSTDAWIDITQQSVREKFMKDGLPVDLGNDGSNPGITPKIYCSLRIGDAATEFANNKGTGGNFTITGSLGVGTIPPEVGE